MTTLARLNIVVAADAAKRTLRDLEGVAKRSAMVIQGAFQRSFSVFQGLTRQIFSLKAAFIGLGAGLVVRDFMKVANTLEQVKFQMVAVTKDTKIANQIFKNTRQFATEVSFSFEDLIGSSTRMAAQLKGDAKEVDFFLRAAADISAVTGLTVEESTNNLMRMLAAGAASADQFRERGVLAMLGFTAGVSYSAEETKKKLVAAFQSGGSILEGVAGQMSTTFSGALSMIGDKIFELKATLMEAGVFDFLKEATQVINSDLDRAIGDLKKNATAAGETITNFLEGALIFAAGAVDGMRNAMNMFLNFYDAMTSAYNDTNTLTNGQIGALGLVGYILFGTAGGILGIAGGLLANLSETILNFLAQTMAKMMSMMTDQLKHMSGSINVGDNVGQLGALEAMRLGAKRSGSDLSTIKKSFAGRMEGQEYSFHTDFGSDQKLLEAFMNPNSAMTSKQREYLGGIMNMGGVKANGQGQFTATGYRNVTPVIGDLLTKVYNNSLGVASNLESFDATGTINLKAPTIEDLLGMLPPELRSTVGAGLKGATAGNLPTNTTKASDYVASMLSRMNSRRNSPNPHSGLSGGTGGDTPTTPPSSGPTKPLAAHVLQAQMNTELEKMIGLLQTGEMTFDQFNSQKELMGQLIAAEIPLVGQLTAEQQKEKDNITALHKGTEKYNKMLEKLGVTYSNTASKFSEGFLTAAAVAGDAAEKTMQFGTQMYQGLEDGLDQFLRTGKFNFQNFMRDMAQEFLIMTAKMAMAKMATAMFGGFMAGGGQMTPNRAYVVGERGREVFVPNEAGRLYSNDQLGGGGVTINQSFDFRNADQGTEARLRQQAAVIQENTRRSIYQDMQDGGSISKLTGRR